MFRVSILTILVTNRVWLLHSNPELGMFFYRMLLFPHYGYNVKPTKALHNVNIGLNKGTCYKTGLDEDINFLRSDLK